MIWIGLALLVLGFVLVAPRGATAGSVSRRVVRMPAGSFFTTRGYQDDLNPASRKARIIIGIVLLAAGGAIMWFAV